MLTKLQNHNIVLCCSYTICLLGAYFIAESFFETKHCINKIAKNSYTHDVPFVFQFHGSLSGQISAVGCHFYLEDPSMTVWPTEVERPSVLLPFPSDQSLSAVLYFLLPLSAHWT